jgi:histidinol dehydrogenase
MVIADETADPEIIAADLLAQSEHDLVAKAILVITDEETGLEAIRQVEDQLRDLSTAGIAAKSWEDYGEVLLADDLDEAIAYANEYAPEHLELCIKEVGDKSDAAGKGDAVIEKLRNYGSLFIGQNTAEVFGDYASGTNHTLPTLGAARYTGGVWVGTFLKVCTDQSMTDQASSLLAPLVSRLAEKEGLMAHKHAADVRSKR